MPRDRRGCPPALAVRVLIWLWNRVLLQLSVRKGVGPEEVSADEDLLGKFAKLTQNLLGQSTWQGESIHFSRVSVAKLSTFLQLLPLAA